MTRVSPAIAIPTLEPVADFSLQVAAPTEVGVTALGQRRVIPILSGTVRGPRLNGRILPGGADFQLIVGPTMAKLDARYVLETDGGDLVFVQNSALRVAPPEVTARLLRGEPVDPALVYFRCAPSFETAAPSLAWINERMFVGTGVRRPDEVQISVWCVA